jgi:xylan 1,4-beta-xylosidase
MGSPQHPTSKQIVLLEKSGKLELLQPVQDINISNNEAVIRIQLPRQSVTLVKLTY